MGVCNCSMFCCTLLYVHFSIAIILMGKRELIALLNLSSWCLVMVERLYLTVPRGCLQFVIVVFPDHTHLLFLVLKYRNLSKITISIFNGKIGNTILKTWYRNFAWPTGVHYINTVWVRSICFSHISSGMGYWLRYVHHGWCTLWTVRWLSQKPLR